MIVQPARRMRGKKNSWRMNFLDRRSKRTGHTRKKSIRWWHDLAEASREMISLHKADLSWRRRSLRTQSIKVWAAETRQGSGRWIKKKKI